MIRKRMRRWSVIHILELYFFSLPLILWDLASCTVHTEPLKIWMKPSDVRETDSKVLVAVCSSALTWLFGKRCTFNGMTDPPLHMLWNQPEPPGTPMDLCYPHGLRRSCPTAGEETAGKVRDQLTTRMRWARFLKLVGCVTRLRSVSIKIETNHLQKLELEGLGSFRSRWAFWIRQVQHFIKTTHCCPTAHLGSKGHWQRRHCPGMDAKAVLLLLFPLLTTLTTHSWSTSTSSFLFCYVVTSKATVKTTVVKTNFILQAGRDKACHTSLINNQCWLEETRFLCPAALSPVMLNICMRKEPSISVPGLLLGV